MLFDSQNTSFRHVPDTPLQEEKGKKQFTPKQPGGV
jgi:hypothetical protein